MNTITDPFSGNLEETKSLGDTLGRLALTLLPSTTSDLSRLHPKRVLPIIKASPSNSKSYLGFLTDLRALTLNPEIYQAMLSYSKEIGSEFHTWMESTRLVGSKLLMQNGRGVPLWSLGPKKDAFRKEDAIGQLSFKVEPAGKVRTFALVDL